MSDNMKGLDTFAVGYAAAEAKMQFDELEALKRERAMMVEAINGIGWEREFLSHECEQKLDSALSATESQATQWLEEHDASVLDAIRHRVRNQSLEIYGVILCEHDEVAHWLFNYAEELRLAASKRKEQV